MKPPIKPLLFLCALLVFGCQTPNRPVPGGTSAASPAAAERETAAPSPMPAAEFAVSNERLRVEGDAPDGNRVFYEIFVGSFSDSDGDGIGDLRGIIERMDYLNDGDPNSGRSLGVEGLWLTPIFLSPSYHKYDVTDYYTIDPAFGTEADLVELIELCHARNVKLILDLPINHTGSGNAWFHSFCAAQRADDRTSEFFDFYAFYDSAASEAPAGRAFSPIAGTTRLYECNFSSDMPELNFDSDAVRQAVVDVARHYLRLGVDGFRFDAAKYIYFGDHSSSFDFWKWYLDTLRTDAPDLFSVAEVWDGDGITDLYYPSTDCFDFTIAGADGLLAETANKGDVNRYTAYVEAYRKRVGALRDNASIVPFLTNHDMDRAAGFLTTASGAMQMAANLYLLGPGTPFLYYGEELGLRGSRGGSQTDANRRLAMPWGDGDTVKDPVGTTYDADRVYQTAREQIADPSSLYTHYKTLLLIRKANPAIAHGTYTALKNTGSKVGGFTAEYNGSAVLVLHNTTLSEKTVDLSALTERPFSTLRAVIGRETASLDGTTLTLGAQTSVVIGCGA